MFDYQTSKHAHFDAACRAFALTHNLEDVAAAVGMRPQILRNKLNPVQPHRLTCDELLAITDYTEDARLLDGMLGQINCLPSVPVNNATEAEQQDTLKKGIENLIRCAFRENADYDVKKTWPYYSAVPLPVPIAGNDSGMFQFPPEGTLVEIASTGGRPDKPFVRQTVPDGTSLPDIQPGEQLQQQRAEVSQRVTQAGDWVRQTDQTISETSMARVVKADTEQRELVSRETTVKATDKITVLGTSTLLAGAIQQVCTGDYSQAVNNRVASIGGNDETDIAGSQTVTTGKDLIEKIGQIRKSVAAVQQQIIAPVVWIGSGTINVAQLMLDTLDVVKELAEQTASHTHSNTGAPTNAGAIRNTGTKADTLNGKYFPVIGK